MCAQSKSIASCMRWPATETGDFPLGHPDPQLRCEALQRKRFRVL